MVMDKNVKLCQDVCVMQKPNNQIRREEKYEGETKRTSNLETKD